jgi:tetratricopeptide (TPR) repeat protein
MRALISGIILVMVMGLEQYGLAGSYPDQPTQDMKSMSVAELEQAADLFRAQKDYERAIEYFREALRKDKKNPVLYNKMAMAELKSGNVRRARVDFAKAIKLNKKYADALNNLGAAYYLDSNFNEAAKYFKKAVALEETRATFHLNLGAAWFSQKKLDYAIAEYSRALQLDPQVMAQTSPTGIAAQITTPEEQANFYYLLAKIRAQRGDIDECLMCLRKAKESGHRNLANVYKDESFSSVWKDGRLAEIIPSPEAK